MSSTTMWLHVAALPAACMLDLFLGDPSTWPHPIRWMGKAISQAEPFFRRLIPNEILAGAGFALFLILSTWVLAAALLTLTWNLHPFLGFFVESIALFYCFSARSLYQAGMEISDLLLAGEEDAARDAVQMIVGRDVTHYKKDDIARATVETVAENVVDGVLAPLCYACLGGAPLALAYKMINTLDSMVGYKNERYLHFGRVAARIDDLANFLPARLGTLFIALAATLLPSTSGRLSLQTAWLEGSHHKSPNAGYSEAAFAGALRRRLNGPNLYGGILVDKPWLGSNFASVQVSDITQACTLMVLSSALGAVTMSLIRYFILTT